MALTYDDGPYPPYTNQLLDILYPNIFDQKQGIDLKNSPRWHGTCGPNNWYDRSRISSPVTDIRARCSQSAGNFTINRVFPVAVAEEKYPVGLDKIRISAELFLNTVVRSRPADRLNFLLV